MRLAWHQGRTLREVLAVLDADELTLWLAWERVEGPLGPERDDLRAAQTSATVLNLFRGKRDRPVSPVDLMPDWGRERHQRRRRQSEQAWMRHLAELKARRIVEDSASG